MKRITVRDVPDRLSRALERERRRRSKSLNRTVLDLLEGSLGLDAGTRFDNGLGRLAGSWTDRDLEEFVRNTAMFEQVDEEVWK